MAKSPEGRAADKVIRALEARGLHLGQVGYHLFEGMTVEDRNVFMEVFFHFLKTATLTEPPAHLTPDMARMYILADSIVTGLENSGYILS